MFNVRAQLLSTILKLELSILIKPYISLVQIMFYH